MSIDWMVVATIAAPIITLFVGVWVDRRFENRPTLISYFGNVAAFTHTTEAGLQIQIHTHTVVLRNAGRRSATNVRLHHATLPDFNIWPQVVYHVEELADRSKDIVIPTLVPGEQITLSYLYFPPITVVQVNAGIKCDQGFAKQIPVLLQRQYPRWISILAAMLMLIGIISILYLAYVALSRFVA